MDFFYFIKNEARTFSTADFSSHFFSIHTFIYPAAYIHPNFFKTHNLKNICVFFLPFLTLLCSLLVYLDGASV